MKEIMSKWIELWDKITEMEHIIYNQAEVNYVLGELYGCLNITNTTEFRSITSNRLTKCIADNKVDIAKRDTNFLSFLLGEGAKIEETQTNLNDLTDIYNNNFRNIGKDEEMLRIKLNQMITNENKLNKQS